MRRWESLYMPSLMAAPVMPGGFRCAAGPAFHPFAPGFPGGRHGSGLALPADLGVAIVADAEGGLQGQGRPAVLALADIHLDRKSVV